MASISSERESDGRGGAQFATTHWSTVMRAGDSASPAAYEVLELGRKVVVRIIGATEPTDTVQAAPVAECRSEPCVERRDVL